jgi:S1-C subfamily serine protease
MEKGKALIISFALLFGFITNSFAQNATKNPYVENHSQSNIADSPIVGVYVENDVTFVVFEYITSRYLSEGWLSLSSKTTLTAKNSNISLKIKDWGVYNDEAKLLNFDERYSVKSDRKYTFFMVFSKVPTGIENITIRENLGSEEFYWKGIHINNSSEPSGSSNVPFSSHPESNNFEISGSGSGFAVNSIGLIVTSYHVVESANKIQIRGINGDFDKVFKAKVLASDHKNDLAVLKIDDSKFTRIDNIPFSLSDRIADVGEDIFVLGYPLRSSMGDEIKLTNGIISSKSGFQGDITAYQISAQVQAGNSGCPLFDKNGNIIGVVNARHIVESVAYAVKTSYLRNLLSSLDNSPTLSSHNELAGKSLSEQVKLIKKFVYIIEIE